MAKIARHSKFCPTPTQVSVLSYNLLAPAYVRPVDKRTGTVQSFAAFEWCTDAAVDWSARRPMLRSELLACDADVICLQEVEFEAVGSSGEAAVEAETYTLPAWLRLDGFRWVIPDQAAMAQMAQRNARVLGAPAAIGNALLYRTDRLERVSEGDASVDGGSTRCVVALLRGSAERLSALEPTAFCSVHLDATSEAKRVQQLLKCIAGVRRKRGTRSVVVAGDMNTELPRGGAVETLLGSASSAADDDGDDGGDAIAAACAIDTRGRAPSAAELASWIALRRASRAEAAALRLRLARAPTGATRAGYDHDAGAAAEKRCAAWALDHIVYSTRTLRLRAVWETLEVDDASRAEGLPNARCPSDHLPVAALFDIVPAAALDAAARAALARQWTALAAEESAALALLQPAAPAAAGGAARAAAMAADAGAEAATKKKKRAKKSRPSAAEIAALRALRQERKAAQAAFAARRDAFRAALNDVELDALEDYLLAATPPQPPPRAAKKGQKKAKKAKKSLL